MDSPEVKLARTKLDGVLASLVERDSDDESHGGGYLAIKKEPDENVFDVNGMLISPRKRPPQRVQGRNVNKKRRKKEDSRESSKNNLLLSLMDRRFSFDQFPDNVSLYVLCRAWIRSFVGVDSQSTSTEPSAAVIRASKIPGATLKLPSPEKGTRAITEPPLKIPTKYPLDFNNLAAAEDRAPNITLLKLEHIARWREQRERYRALAAKNERRYKSSLALLKQLYLDRRHIDA